MYKKVDKNQRIALSVVKCQKVTPARDIQMVATTRIHVFEMIIDNLHNLLIQLISMGQEILWVLSGFKFVKIRANNGPQSKPLIRWTLHGWPMY